MENLPLSGANPAEGARSTVRGADLLRQIRARVPRAWMPIARRGSSRVLVRLPAPLRNRLLHLLESTQVDMGDIQRDYQFWIELYDRPGAAARSDIKAKIARMQQPPLISVLMPVFNPVPDHLQAAINSLVDQIYPFWELCIGDDASTDQRVISVLRDAVGRDPRIKLVRREQNGHISAASNSALRLASGSFVALLDHDDLLPAHALYEVAARITAQPEVDIIYSDEDHIDNQGRRSHPYFKPDWNKELMLGQNLISHLGVYRRALVERTGGFRVGFEGSQDHDLALRVVAETRADRIAHIPKVLYHWRQGAADRTFSEASHDRCVRNGRRAVQDFVTRDRPGARVEPAPLAPDWTRVVYPVPAPAPLVSVIISCDGSVRTPSDCVEELLKQTDYTALEVLILTAEAEPTPASAGLPGRMEADRRVRVLHLHPAMMNDAVEATHGSLILMFDADLRPGDPGWLRELVSRAACADIGAVGPRLLSAEGNVRHAGLVIGGAVAAFGPFLDRLAGQAGYFGHLQLARDVTALSGKCLLVRRQAFLAVGGLDEGLSLNEFGDIDLCLKLTKAGYRIMWTPYADLYLDAAAPGHRARTAQLEHGAARLRERWGPVLDADRYWSPNLSCRSGEVGLAFPPRTVEGRSLDQEAREPSSASTV